VPTQVSYYATAAAFTFLKYFTVGLAAGMAFGLQRVLHQRFPKNTLAEIEVTPKKPDDIFHFNSHMLYVAVIFLKELNPL